MVRELTEKKYKGFEIHFTKSEIEPHDVSAFIYYNRILMSQTYGYDKVEAYMKAKRFIDDLR